MKVVPFTRPLVWPLRPSLKRWRHLLTLPAPGRACQCQIVVFLWVFIYFFILGGRGVQGQATPLRRALYRPDLRSEPLSPPERAAFPESVQAYAGQATLLGISACRARLDGKAAGLSWR